jgi:LmbE family N-acetylglucosaminyl deacetylase
LELTEDSILIFSPHIDDEILGCFSFLGPAAHVLFFGVEERAEASRGQRIAELEASAGLLNFQWSLLDHSVNRYAAADLIGPMEEAINARRPDVVLMPVPSYNQDHRAVFDAGMVATRPHDRNWRVGAVLLFEQPDSILWPHSPIPEPALFREIDVERKLAAYALYASQVRGHRSPATVKALARLRGAQISRPFAEAFHVKRLVVGS